MKKVEIFFTYEKGQPLEKMACDSVAIVGNGDDRECENNPKNVEGKNPHPRNFFCVKAGRCRSGFEYRKKLFKAMRRGNERGRHERHKKKKKQDVNSGDVYCLTKPKRALKMEGMQRES